MAEAVIGDALQQIVRDARLPSEAARNKLRRELASHFEDAVDSSAAADAVRRFGNVAAVAESFRDVYRCAFTAVLVTSFRALHSVTAEHARGVCESRPAVASS